jgi:hypothetical protein
VRNLTAPRRQRAVVRDSGCSVRQPGRVKRHRRASRHPGVGVVWFGRLVLDSGAMPNGGRIDGIRAPADARRSIPSLNSQNNAGTRPRAQHDVTCSWWAMNEVPRPQRVLFPFDDQEAFARENQEILLVGLPVILRHRLPRIKHAEVDSDLLEPDLTFKLAHRRTARRMMPTSLARVENKPPLTHGNKTRGASANSAFSAMPGPQPSNAGPAPPCSRAQPALLRPSAGRRRLL